MKWKEFNSIKDIPATLWSNIENGYPCLSYDFMGIVESIHPKDSFNYAILYKDDTIVGISFYYIFNALPSVLKKLPLGRILMTGTFETYGKHWWYDASLITECEFLESFWTLIKRHKVAAFIYRDYVSNECTTNQFYENYRFRHLIPYSSASIEIQKDCNNLNDFFSGMAKKHRNMYKKFIRQRESQNTTFRIEYDIKNNLGKLYQLYLNVHNHASEFKSPAIPTSFFTMLEERLKEDCFCIVMSKNEEDIGFVLMIQGHDIVIPFLMGINYNYRELHVWHNLTIECVKYTIESGRKYIDLGLTNYQLKKRLGAKETDIHMFGRLKNNFINRYCNSVIEKLL